VGLCNLPSIPTKDTREYDFYLNLYANFCNEERNWWFGAVAMLKREFPERVAYDMAIRFSMQTKFWREHTFQESMDDLNEWWNGGANDPPKTHGTSFETIKHRVQERYPDKKYVRDSDEEKESVCPGSYISPFGTLSWGEYDLIEDDEDFLVEGCIIEGQCVACAAPSKCEKTTEMLDLAVCVATGSDYLGKKVKQSTVLIFTGESGGKRVRKNIRAMAKAYGVDLAVLRKRLFIAEKLPHSSNARSVIQFRDEIKHFGAGLVILDPAYLAIDGSDATNLMKIGPEIAKFRDACDDATDKKGTFILVHHTNKKIPIGSIPNMGDMHMTGFEQLFRQFIFINRLKEYSYDGHHEIVMAFSGSSGHAATFNVTIDEGVLTADNDLKWEIKVEDRREAARQSADEEYAKLSAEILTLIHRLPLSSRNIRESLEGFTQTQVDECLARLSVEQLATKNKSGRWQLPHPATPEASG
jgi:hypothetical protein